MPWSLTQQERKNLTVVLILCAISLVGYLVL